MPQKLIDMTGCRVGRLKVLHRAPNSVYGTRWVCLCTCGKEVTVQGSNLRKATTSCGCLALEVRTKHGLSRHPLYMVWANMVRRCGSDSYGGTYKNLMVHPTWKDVKKFIRYVTENLGRKPTRSHSIDRINNNKGYVPGNIRWATPKQQSNNRNCVATYSHKGEKWTIRDFSDKYGIKYATLKTRLRRGIPICQAIELPIRSSGKGQKGEALRGESPSAS